MKRGMIGVLAWMLLAFPAGAPAAAPVNDDFEDRQVLGGSLPIEVNASNVEATSESGEDISFFAAGHSIWFEWEATATQWTTIGACGSDFPALIGVFSGGVLAGLSRVVSGSPSQGPHCPLVEREYTFKAVAGTDYVIGVDGNSFSFPEPPAADTEGNVELRIEATPPPPNDDFADAADLTAAGETYEFESEEPFYFARLESYNWAASKEPGEPDHQGDPGGASAWYEWTAPASGTARMSMCCFGFPLLAIYSGSSLGSLTALPTESEFPPEVTAQVTAGQTYRIAVDGAFDEAAGEARQVFYSVNVSMNLPPRSSPEGPPPPPQPDLTAPETSVSKTVLKRMPPIFSFRFTSSEPGSSFRCSVDNRPFKGCGTSKTFRKGSPGRHRLRVVAVDPAGNADATPAVARFRFPPRHPRPGR